MNATRPAVPGEVTSGRISLAAPRVPDLEVPPSPPPWKWNEPGREELELDDGLVVIDTEPAPPPERTSLNPTILRGVGRAATSAMLHTDAGRHGAAREDAKLIFLKIGAELGLKSNVLAALGDMIDRVQT